MKTMTWLVRQAFLALSAPLWASLPGGVLLFLAALGGHVALLAAVRHREWNVSARHRIVQGITFGRLTLVMLLGGAAATGQPWLLAAGFWLAALGDALDGHLARRWQVSTPIGGVFDEESDAVFVLALGLALWQGSWLAGWILVPGLLRYAVLLVRLFKYGEKAPALRIPGARWIGGVVFALGPVLFLLPEPARTGLAGMIVIALSLSFALEIRHYVRH
jgi:phosphatidylglycerophosphate synthase